MSKRTVTAVSGLAGHYLTISYSSVLHIPLAIAQCCLTRNVIHILTSNYTAFHITEVLVADKHQFAIPQYYNNLTLVEHL